MVGLAKSLLGSIHNEGSRVAVEDGVRAISYHELRDTVERVAHELNEGFAHGPLILMAERSISGYIAYLSIVAAGRVVVPMPLEAVGGRLESVFQSMFVAGMVSTTPLEGGRATGVGDLGLFYKPVAPEVCATTELPNDVMYVLHTSGTTGFPKAVPITYANVDAMLRAVIPLFDYGPGARCSGLFDLTFDLSVHDLLVPLVSGGTIVIGSKADLMMPDRYVNRGRVTHWFSVPSIIEISRRQRRLGEGALNGLRFSLFCGEALTRDQAAAWAGAAANARLANLYGPTECTVTCAAYLAPSDINEIKTPNDIVPIGETYPEVMAKIGSGRDPRELLLGGGQLFRGYHNRHHGCAFDLEVGSDGPSEHAMYRTGDLVDRTEYGLVYLGRLDRQQKHRGVRFEPEEVEGAFLQSRYVSQASVHTVLRHGLSELIVVLAGDQERGEEVLAIATARLSRALWPDSVRWLPELPTTANGKTDHAAVGQWLKE